jgi:hypothetical protein
MRRRPFRFLPVFSVLCAVSAVSMALVVAAAQTSQPPQPALAAADAFKQVFSATILTQILAGSAVITAAINVIWFCTSSLISRFLHWWNAKSKVCQIDFSRGINKANYEKLTKLISGFYCLVVRYGTDQYVGSLASDQERYEGRLKNEKRKISVRFDDKGNAILTLNLPVHKRMGTQFKCFAEAKGDEFVEETVAFLKNCDRIREVSVSKSIHTSRIYFLLDRFDEVTTIEGFKNNIVLPE